jgi:hypothetical protein
MTLGSTGTRLREYIFFKTREKSQNRYISHMRGGAHIQPIAMEVCALVEVTNVTNNANFDGSMLSGLVSAKG